jgi:predicted membrane-bound spermidine synthase
MPATGPKSGSRSRPKKQARKEGSTPQAQATSNAHPVPDAAAPGQGWLLIALVFLGGMSSLAIEMTAARLVEPYFGDSQFVWATLIGLTLIYLTLGYYLGGRLADHAPHPLALYRLTAFAAAAIGLIPVLANSVLTWTADTFAQSASDFSAGPLIAILLLFSLPVILLGCVSPFAIRLRVKAVGSAGSTAGRLYALSTVGSILGTFLPVFWLMPTIGTRATIFIFAGLLMAISALGLIAQARRSSASHP